MKESQLRVCNFFGGKMTLEMALFCRRSSVQFAARQKNRLPVLSKLQSLSTKDLVCGRKERKKENFGMRV